MPHSIESTNAGLHINVSADLAKQPAVLEAFAKCAAGACACPTSQFDKVQSVEIKPQQTGVTVDLGVRPDQTIALADVERRWAHMAQQVGN